MCINVYVDVNMGVNRLGSLRTLYITYIDMYIGVCENVATHILLLYMQKGL